VVTRSNTVVGKELAQMLYYKHAKVYIATLSKEKALKTRDDVNKAVSDFTGDLVFLHIDLPDLSIIKASAEKSLSKESKLHVIFNNAGVMNLHPGSKTVQNYEFQLGTNNLDSTPSCSQSS